MYWQSQQDRLTDAEVGDVVRVEADRPYVGNPVPNVDDAAEVEKVEEYEYQVGDGQHNYTSEECDNCYDWDGEENPFDTRNCHIESSLNEAETNESANRHIEAELGIGLQYMVNSMSDAQVLQNLKRHNLNLPNSPTPKDLRADLLDKCTNDAYNDSYDELHRFSTQTIMKTWLTSKIRTILCLEWSIDEHAFCA
ncbi:hypothetical protein SARC_00853 [Sphaeroforma arctica JP610]|uniref:Uncharacterized protein n=1 Tax=Sphaeroforma arctica JP610 TaxID=667725 RepID=A0A0L0GFI7_9EUKA|nr:hypothetical protein SARC_00853 [Sphaeroforma arctica JP610]KNC87043.1 hypothetical protein SARC_00853 [Sphaeroforma arctica JP610]|eukprot:XP_014160945.1 hypothetical protein SARC_00853 [Sphaeroforma arctica JP610]